MTPADRIIAAPAERRLAVVQVIASARRRLILSPGECDDRRVIEALQAAVRRGVRVEALLTRRTKDRSGLRLLRLLLEAIGVRVWRYDGPHGKYHAKYAVADRSCAFVGSMNLTRWCFRRSCDFLVVTHDRAVARGLTALFEADCRATGPAPLPDLPERLIVGPEAARTPIADLMAHARKRIRLIDPKLEDPRMLALLGARASTGIRVMSRRQSQEADLAPHGKLLIIDDELALVGSMALSSSNLDRRREVGITVSDPAIVRRLLPLFEGHRHEMHHRGRVVLAGLGSGVGAGGAAPSSSSARRAVEAQLA